MFLNSFLSGFFIPLYCYAHFAEKVHPLRNALIRYGVTFDNNVANLVTLGTRLSLYFMPFYLRLASIFILVLLDFICASGEKLS